MPLAPVILAWAINPLFFWAGLLLAGIPIIIHILNRRRYRIVRWAAMEYLLQAMRKNRRRLKFEQIILLAIRCAVLALLGLALARPLGCSDTTLAALAGQRSALHVFIIDNSYSMAYEAERPGAKTHLDQAKILAKQQIDRLTAGSESVAIISAASLSPAPKASKPGEAHDQDHALILRPTFDLRQASEAVDRIEQTYGGTDIPGALQSALQLAAEEKKQPQKYLYILSDNTRSAWETRKPELMKQLGHSLETAYGRGHIRLFNLGREGQWNYAVLDVRPDGGLVRAKLDTDFLADVKGFGQGPESIVQWKWDEKVLPDAARIKPDTQLNLQRQRKADLTDGGVHVISVSLVNDERLRADNSRYRVVEVASELKVLIVEGERSSGSTSLDLALAPKKEIGPTGAVRSDSYVAPEIISDLELGNRVLEDYRAIMLTNVGSLSFAQAGRIARFVAQGGTLMVFMGNQVSADLYNSALYGQKLLPGKLVARKSASAGAGAYTLDFRPNSPTLHPLLGLFRGEEQSGLNTAQIDTYYQLELDPALKAETVLKYMAGEKETNDPAITVHKLDKGRIVVFTTTATSDWNSLPLKPAYPVLLHELLAGTVNVGDRWMNLLVGQPLRVPPTLRLTAAPVLMNPAAKQVAVEPVTGEDGQTTYTTKPLDKPGLYRLSIGTATLPIAVNIPADEADIRTMPSAAIVKALGDVGVQLYGDTIPQSALSRDDSNDLGWTLMAIVLGLVGLECFLAMKFGHFKKPTIPKPEALAAQGA